MASKRALERARGLIGVRFRAQGRERESGLDCVGLVAAAFRLPLAGVPDDYRLSSGMQTSRFLRLIDSLFRRVSKPAPGNLVVMTIGQRLLHMGVTSEAGVIHADMRRRAVIEGPVPENARVVGYYRKRRQALPKGGR